MNNSINGEKLKTIGFTEGKVLGLALTVCQTYLADMPEEEVLSLLEKFLASPADYKEDKILQGLAQELIKEQQDKVIALKETLPEYKVFGREHIEEGALAQMETAMRLPVTVAGALMPDAHQGYGLPIGGVLAVHNAVIPYGVGVDIGCRMALSIFDIPESYFLENESLFKRGLIAFTRFGAGAGWHGKDRADHEVLERQEFNLVPFIKSLKDKAAQQLGTSGGGNHFVEWGLIDILADDDQLEIPKGKYVALLTHSGSRGFGATIAGHYTKLAKERCQLPPEARNLAYLGLDSNEGLEYWLAMNLAGDYASACHEIIHRRLEKAIGGRVLAKVENHHNFAWKELYQGEEVIVHRKGATPASEGVLGIIPGSMTAPGFLVRGRGEPSSINSASHGAGRQMSRTQAMNTVTSDEMKRLLEEHGVTLIGAGLDEAPMAYKDIRTVMAAQKNLVDVLAMFTPRIVRMADDGSRED